MKMKRAPRLPAEELHMKGSEFDKIMRCALQVHPGEAPKRKRAVKSKAKRKSSGPTK